MSSYVTIDEGSDKKIGVLEKTESSTTIEIQRYQKADVPLSFTQILSPTTTSGSESTAVTCDGKSNVNIFVLFTSTSDTSITARLKYKCYHDEIVYSSTKTINNTSILDVNSNYYIGELLQEDVSLYKEFSVRLTSTPTSNITIYAG